ncbi:YihY/virulence factor BrkB family protein [Mesobaculum littorinae]|uniref:YihY/virulence factor BrkB family protein n=1 Tax=Mesobaculum littorinae TaxID=2486419 RepID=A0A438ADL2_9RHOB|nr:YihY/virulence factor BrkB family protein [Mesobaculum littorinae]RVV96793.1 YihY/virulence factor BrkB family protein [Mesobaculum littorinae]
MPETRPRPPGADATAPTAIPKAGWMDILKRVWTHIGDDHVSVVAAGVAFFGLLAIFPAITALISLAALVLDPAMIEEQLTMLAGMLPQNAAEIITSQATQVAGGDGAGKGLAMLIGLVLAIYGASKGVKTLMEGMNIAYEEDEQRNIVVLTLISLALTLFLILGLIIALLVALAIPAAFAFFPAPNWIEQLVSWLRWPVLAVFVILGLNVLYRFGPCRSNARWRWINPGSVLATVVWIAGTLLFTIYATNFGSYNETYGTLGGVIVLLTWLWLSAFIVLLGAELNSEIEHQTARDSTTGPEEPMGERGAVQADRVAGDGSPEQRGF